MKKYFATVLLLLVGFAAWGQSPFDIDTKVVITKSGDAGLVFKSSGSDKLYYKINSDNKTVTVTRDVQAVSKGRVEIPSKVTHKGVTYTVTAIGTGALSNQKDLTAVVVPSTVKTIQSKAFANCPNLTSVSIPSSVQSLSIDACSGCNRLTTIRLPKALKMTSLRDCPARVTTF
ncbi:MAG: leucine-rich repeat domain-containing protein [Bacteroidales bacterium]|nr:leucine-rich repeat domain-containing protein [Bacteroidales bacterium]